MKTATQTAKTETEHVSLPMAQRKQDFFSTKKSQAKPFFGPASIQAKLDIGQPGDPYEREADKVADQVMRMPNLGMPVSQGEDVVQRKSLVQRNTAQNGGGQTVSPEISSKISSTRGSGTPLPKNTQNEMGSKIGADFSGVKIHTDNTAIQLSQDLGAKAFTVGNDIYFNKGQYNPSSGDGKRLMAHELVHTVQQGGGSVRGQIQRQETEYAGTDFSDYIDSLTPVENLEELDVWNSIILFPNDYEAVVFDSKNKKVHFSLRRTLYINFESYIIQSDLPRDGQIRVMHAIRTSDESVSISALLQQPWNIQELQKDLEEIQELYPDQKVHIEDKSTVPRIEIPGITRMMTHQETRLYMLTLFTQPHLMVTLEGLLAISHSRDVTFGLGLQLGAAGVIGVSGSGGYVISEGQLGFYGGFSGDLGATVGASAEAVFTAIKGGVDKFSGTSLALVHGGGELIVGHFAVLSSTEGDFLGIAISGGLGMGLTVVEIYVSTSHTFAPSEN